MQAINYENKDFSLTEPFDGLFTQGMVCHETYKDQNNNWLSPNEIFTDDGKSYYKKKTPSEIVTIGSSESMSKSKKNTIDPESIIENYGADSVRLFILSDSPPEKDVQWSEQGMKASYKFLQKLWLLHQKIKEKINLKNASSNQLNNISKFTNQLIYKVTNNLEKFHYNGIVANLYETYNFMIKITNQPLDQKDLLINYKKILYLMMPLVPHFASECLENLKITSKVEWPIANKKILMSEEINMVIQVNGKKRSIINCKKEINEDSLIKLIKDDKKLDKFIKNKKIVRSIFIKNKLINLIVKE
jgi:leucyl-tRNA synthetase